MNAPPPRDPECSFCKMPKSLAKHMFANHDDTKHIYGKCVASGADRLKETT